MIATLHDLQSMLAAPTTYDAALAHLQTLLDEEYGYDASGVWAVVGNGGLARLGLSRAEAVAMGAVDRAVPEPVRTVDLAAAKAAACDRIDAQAEALRSRVLTPGAGQMAAYQAKEEQAKAFLQDATPTEAEYPDVYNEIGITADTAAAVAMAILAAAEKWRVYGRAVEKARLTGKKAVNAATDPVGVEAAAKAVVWP